MLDNTRKILDDWKKMGVDVSAFEAQINSNPNLDRHINDGITRLPEFTKIVNEKRLLENQVAASARQLAAGHDILNSNTLAPEQQTGLQNWVNELERWLIDEGYPEEEVKELSNQGKNLILSTPTPQNPTNNPLQPKKEEEIVMKPEEIDAMIQQKNAEGVLSSVGINFAIQGVYSRFNELYGRAPNAQEVEAYGKAFNSELQKGNQNAINDAAESAFKFTERQTTVQTELRTREIEQAKTEGYNKALAENKILPAPNRNQFNTSPIFRRPTSQGQIPVLQNQVQNPPSNPTSPNPNPVNPAQANTSPQDPFANLRDEGGLLPYQRRGDRASRMQGVRDFIATNNIDLSDTYGIRTLLPNENNSQT